jgi:ATP-dependent Clp protease ATP-binding subunit ClpA
MLEPSKDLEQIFEYAVQSASTHNHEYITLEHFLCGMLNNKPFIEILTAFGTNVESLKKDVEKFIDEKLLAIVNPNVTKPKKTETVERMLNRAFTHVAFSGRQTIDHIDCFVSLFSEKKSHATYFINKAETEKDKFIDFLNKEIVKIDDTDEVTPKKQIDHIINKFCVNLTDLAKNKKIDPVIGRETEIENITLILARRTKANAIFNWRPRCG